MNSRNWSGRGPALQLNSQLYCSRCGRGRDQKNRQPRFSSAVPQQHAEHRPQIGRILRCRPDGPEAMSWSQTKPSLTKLLTFRRLLPICFRFTFCGAEPDHGGIRILNRNNRLAGGAVSLTLNFLRFGAVLTPKLGNAYASSLVQTAPVSTRCDPAGRMALLPVHPQFS